MKFNNANEIEAHIASQDPLACNVCQAVLHWLRNRTKLWLVTTETSSAVVYGKNQTEAMTVAGFKPMFTYKGITCEEIDPDDVSTRPYERSGHQYMVMEKTGEDC